MAAARPAWWLNACPPRGGRVVAAVVNVKSIDPGGGGSSAAAATVAVSGGGSGSSGVCNYTRFCGGSKRRGWACHERWVAGTEDEPTYTEMCALVYASSDVRPADLSVNAHKAALHLCPPNA